MSIQTNLESIKTILPASVTLVAVSKTWPVEDLMEAYDTGQRVFGENKIQEMAAKYEQMPKDSEWHMIGHVQTNKVKYMAPFVSLIHSIDSLKLLAEVNKQAQKNNRVIHCLLQMHIAQEETKFGLDEDELNVVLTSDEFKAMQNIKITGLMGMATFTSDKDQVKQEFCYLKSVFDKIAAQPETSNFKPGILSMGMSDDYLLAISCGSNMVRIGNSIFGNR